MIRVVHPGSRIRMLTFSHPGSRIQGSKKAPNPGSRIRIRNTANKTSKETLGFYPYFPFTGHFLAFGFPFLFFLFWWSYMTIIIQKLKICQMSSAYSLQTVLIHNTYRTAFETEILFSTKQYSWMTYSVSRSCPKNRPGKVNNYLAFLRK